MVRTILIGGGLALATTLSVTLYCCLVVASRADDELERRLERKQEEEK